MNQSNLKEFHAVLGNLRHLATDLENEAARLNGIVHDRTVRRLVAMAEMADETARRLNAVIGSSIDHALKEAQAQTASIITTFLEEAAK